MPDSAKNMAAATNATTEDPALLSRQWEDVKPLLRRDLGDNNFRSWILPLVPQSFAAGVLVLGVPTRFMRDWVRAHYADRIRALWSQYCGSIARVDVVVSDSAVETASSVAALRLPAANDTQAVEKDDLSSPLDARYTFDSFVSGPANGMAFAATRKMAESDAVEFNPLCIYGAVGMGKTHLLQAAAAAIRARRPEARIVYMSAEKFMYRFVQALRDKDTMAFKAFFRTVDVLMMDDIQFICGKGATQDEFLYTFNALLDEGKQVVIASDRAPTDLDGVGERLRSRLGMGLVARIDNADESLRLAILRSKCRLMKRDVPEDVLTFLAASITTNVRELEGALNRLLANAELMGRAVTLDSARDLLQDLLRTDSQKIGVEDIQKKVAAHYNIRLSDLLSPRRARPVARPRQVAMYLSKILTECSLPDIGRKFGGRDHTTIMHGIRKIEDLMTSDPVIARDVAVLKAAMGG